MWGSSCLPCRLQTRLQTGAALCVFVNKEARRGDGWHSGGGTQRSSRRRRSRYSRYCCGEQLPPAVHSQARPPAPPDVGETPAAAAPLLNPTLCSPFLLTHVFLPSPTSVSPQPGRGVPDGGRSKEERLSPSSDGDKEPFSGSKYRRRFPLLRKDALALPEMGFSPHREALGQAF